MKKILLIVALIFGAGFANAQSKMAHLNSQEVMAAMPSYKKAIEELETFRREGLAELEMMYVDLEKAGQKYLAERDAMAPVRRQIEEEKLGKKEQAIEEREQSFQRELDAYSRELNQPIITKLESALKIVTDRYKYDYVFDITMLMIHNGPDLTKEVIVEVLKLDVPAVKPATPVVGQ